MEQTNTVEVFEKLLDKDFSFEGFSFDTFVGLGTEALESKEIYHKVLGRIVSGLGRKYGDKSVQRFADALEDTTGKKVSPNTLRNYRWVYERVGQLNPPTDLSYKAWQTLASSENPQMWLDKLKETGWSPSELIREIRMASGKVTAPKLYTCPRCLNQFEVKN